VPQTAFAVDESDRPRLGDQGIALFDSCPHQAVMDHHPTNEGFGQVFALDGGAAAAGELAVDLVEALGVSLTPEMAECLFVAISTDCGQFNYSNTRPETFTAAAKCAAKMQRGVGGRHCARNSQSDGPMPRLVFPAGEDELVSDPNNECRLRVVFNGAEATGTPLIARMAVQEGILANILSASTRSVHERTYGSMLLGVPSGGDAVQRAISYLQQMPDVIVEEV